MKGVSSPFHAPAPLSVRWVIRQSLDRITVGSSHDPNRTGPHLQVRLGARHAPSSIHIPSNTLSVAKPDHHRLAIPLGQSSNTGRYPVSVVFASFLTVGIPFCTLSVSVSDHQIVDLFALFTQKWTLCIHRLYRPVSVKRGFAAQRQQKNGAVIADWPGESFICHHVGGFQNPSAVAVLGNLGGLLPRVGIKARNPTMV